MIKITGNSRTYSKMQDDLDFDAGRILSGECGLDRAADELLELAVQVASGARSKPEALGHREYFVSYKHQDTPGLAAGCRA